MTNASELLRSPEDACKPDPRSHIWAVQTTDGQRPWSLDDQHRAVAEIALHTNVPEDILIQFETAKNVFFYAWFVYRFYPVAKNQAFTCLELALRIRFETEMCIDAKKKRRFGPGLRDLLLHAKDNGYLKNEDFEAWRSRTRVRAFQRKIIETTEEMTRKGVTQMEFDEHNIEIADTDRDHDYIGPLCEALPALRNHYAHGSTSLDNQALESLRVVAEIINQIFE